MRLTTFFYISNVAMSVPDNVGHLIFASYNHLDSAAAGAFDTSRQATEGLTVS
jgi:hypothetical protein